MLSRFALLLALFLAGCAHPPVQQPVDPKVLPKELAFRIGNFWSGGYSIKCHGSTVILEDYRHKTLAAIKEPKSLTFQPSADRWKSFWRELRILQVFQWNAAYPTGIVDGEEWDLQISYQGRIVSTQGQCAYPSAKDFRKISEHPERIWMLESAFQRLLDYRL